MNEPFYIAFEGAAEPAAMLRRFVADVATHKVVNSDGSMIVDEREGIIANPKWLDLLDAATIARVTDGHHWELEDILDCMLSAEYQLLDVEFADGYGRLLYDPLAFPFGGTDPLKALVELLGLRVTRDSFHDGYAE